MELTAHHVLVPVERGAWRQACYARRRLAEVIRTVSCARVISAFYPMEYHNWITGFTAARRVDIAGTRNERRSGEPIKARSDSRSSGQAISGRKGFA